MSIPVAHPWPTNSDLLIDAFTLLRAGDLYDDDGDTVLDVTYHTGAWWQKWRPSRFEQRSRLDDPTWDYRAMSLETGSYSIVAYDPPYSTVGGTTTSTVPSMITRYGRDTIAGMNALELIEHNAEGLRECCRVARQVVLLKSMDFVESSILYPQTRLLETVAIEAGWAIYERLIHLPTGGRPQPTLGPNGQPRNEFRARNRPSALSILVPTARRRARTKPQNGSPS